jgi:hypothetical protein
MSPANPVQLLPHAPSAACRCSGTRNCQGCHLDNKYNRVGVSDGANGSAMESILSGMTIPTSRTQNDTRPAREGEVGSDRKESAANEAAADGASPSTSDSSSPAACLCAALLAYMEETTACELSFQDDDVKFAMQCADAKCKGPLKGPSQRKIEQELR